MSILQVIALCTGAVEVVYILLNNALVNSKNWKALFLLFSLALYNAVFVLDLGNDSINIILSFIISFFYLEQNFNNLGYEESSKWKKYVWLSALASIGFIITLTLSSATTSSLSLLTPFLLIQNFLIFAMVKTILDKQKEETSYITALYSNALCVALLSGFFLLDNKQLASYLVTNGFFLLLVLQPFVLQIFSKEKDKETDVFQFESLEDLFNEWNFTKTEKEIAILLIEGKSTNEIATIKFVEEGTVRKHISNLMSKSGVNLRNEFKDKVNSLLHSISDM